MGLRLFIYQGAAFKEYTGRIQSLQFSSSIPGGFGIMRIQIAFSPAENRCSHPEMAILSGKAVLMDGLTCVFTGEIHEAAQVLSAQGSNIELVVHGGAAALADDPQDAAYTNLTAQAILANQIAMRANYLAIDSDLSAILPDQPAATFSPIFDGRTLEDVLHELCDLLGDYVWGVWDHPQHRDRLGFPTWQLAVHKRSTSTITYSANAGDVIAWRIAPAAARAYNAVTLHYLDPLNGPGSVTATDSRLNNNFSQGTAPFRFRRFRRDMGQRVMTQAQALGMAQNYLATFENGSQIITVELSKVRDAQGRRIPLWRMRADAMITIPDLLPRAASFTTATITQPGITSSGAANFYIRQVTYHEIPGHVPTATLLLDQIADYAAADLTRLRYEEQLRQRSRRTGVQVQAAGQLLMGFWSVRWSSGNAGDTHAGPVVFPAVLAQTPTALIFTTLSASNIASGPTAAAFTQWGCEAAVTAASSGSGFWLGTYQTQGN